MNWKKLLLTIGAGSLAGSLGHYATEMADGHHITFTAGNILIPALTTAVSVVAALFAKPPQQQ